ncbi:MAG: patatin-like phospholipase family protein [Acidobacteria bacterium]|nr:patatin-like phospholipase family protein [Acidobacteriota bacterium]
MPYHFRNLVFEGGGVKGIAYVGALQALKKRGILENIRRVGGTSAGAINAVLLGLNYTPAETRKILASLDFRNFLDDSWGIVRDLRRLRRQFGWYKGDYFRAWIARRIEKKTGNPDSTFQDLQDQKPAAPFRDIYLVATNLSTGFAETFSHEHTPETCVADAVRISMSIPLFFAAKRSVRGDLYVDGGLLNNYPIKLFDRRKYLDRAKIGKHSRLPDYYRNHNRSLRKRGNRISPYLFNSETLGFRLDSPKEIAVFRDQEEPARHKIDDFFSYAWTLMGTLLNCQVSQHLHADDWHRTIYIDTLGVNTLDFNLSAPRKAALVRSGKTHTEKYFSWYDDSGNRPANRPPR